MEMPIARPVAGPMPVRQDRLAAAREVAVQFEATFLAEMLKHTGVGAPRKSHGGGVGEDAFASFLATEYAMRMARSGGVGIATVIEAQILSAGGDLD